MPSLNPFIGDNNESDDPLDRLSPIPGVSDEGPTEAQARIAAAVGETAASAEADPEAAPLFESEESEFMTGAEIEGEAPPEPESLDIELDITDAEIPMIEGASMTEEFSADINGEIPRLADGADIDPDATRPLGSESIREVILGDPLFNDAIQEKIAAQTDDLDRQNAQAERAQAVDELVRNTTRNELGGLLTARPTIRQGTGVG